MRAASPGRCRYLLRQVPHRQLGSDVGPIEALIRPDDGLRRACLVYGSLEARMEPFMGPRLRRAGAGSICVQLHPSPLVVEDTAESDRVLSACLNSRASARLKGVGYGWRGRARQQLGDPRLGREGSREDAQSSPRRRQYAHVPARFRVAGAAGSEPNSISPCLLPLHFCLHVFF